MIDTTKKPSSSLTHKLKIAFFIFLPLAVFVSGFMWILFYHEVHEDRIILETSMLTKIKMQKVRIASNFDFIVSDLLFFANYNQLLDSLESGELSAEHLTDDFALFSRGSKAYDQIRMINLEGTEVARVNLVDGKPIIVQRDQLQSKRERYYFKDTIKLDKGELFISPFDLNIEHGIIEEPLKPMIRFGTPIFDREGQKRGGLFFNYLGAKLIQDIHEVFAGSPGFHMMVNAEGYWIIGRVAGDEWGFMYKDRSDRTIGNTFPSQWKRILASNSGQFHDPEGLFTFTTVYPLLESWISSTGAGEAFMPSKRMKSGKEYFWKIVSYIPQQYLVGESNRSLKKYIYIDIIMFLLLGPGSWLLASAKVRHDIDEWNLAKHSEELEGRVEERTVELAEANKDLKAENTERKIAEEEREKVLHDKGERIKELQCMYGLTESIHTRSALEEIFQDVADLIPPGWHYPEITRGKLIFDGKEYVSEPFEETGWKQSSDIIVNGEPRGAIEVYYLEERPVLDEGPFMTEERNLINGMAKNISEAVEHRQMEEKISEEIETTKNLLRLSEATAKTADIDELMAGVVGIAHEITGTNMTVSYLWDGATNTFRPDKAAGLAGGMLPLFRTTPVGLDSKLLKKAMDTGRAFIDYNRTGSEPLKLQQDGLFDWIEDARAISVLPLVGKRAYLGLIVCICIKNDKDECRCVSDKKRALLQAVANQVSTALEEALHYTESVARAMELSRKVETIETMSEISGSILSMLDVHEVIEVTARMVSRLVPSDWVRVIEVDAPGEGFKFIAGFEEGGVLESTVVPFASTSLTEVVDTRRPQYIADLRTIDSPLDVERDLIERGYLSVLRIPITVKGNVAGVLGLMSRRTSAFGPDDLSTLEKLSNQVGVALENARLVTDLKEFSIGTVRALAEAIDAKSPWTSGHSERVTGIALRIGSEMGFSEEELADFRIAGLLHDIGKIGTNESILDKPGKLTDEELSEMRKHSEKGAEILAPIKQLTHILPTIRGHHEFFDGTGYPDGLKGTEIPLQARILTVADTADAMGADRPYRKGLSQETIAAELKRCTGTQFDPEVVAAYLKTLEKET